MSIRDRNISADAMISAHKLNLSNLGINTTGVEQFYVGTDGTQSFELALTRVPGDRIFTTIDSAINACTASRGDIINVLEYHVEDSNAVFFDADVAGIRIVGHGWGSARPRLDYNNAAATIDIGANDVLIHNLVLRPSVTTILIGMDIESGVTGTVLSMIEWAMGEAGDGTDEFVKALHLTSGNHDTIMRYLKILAHASAANATHGIHVDAASDRLTFDHVIIDGPYATNGILEDAAGVNHVAVNCSVDTTGTNYGFHASSTFAERRDNLDAGAPEAATDEVYSDLVIVQSDLKSTLSDLKVADAILDTVASDVVIIQSDVKVINSDLIVTNAIVDTIASDVVIIQSDVKVVNSDLIVTNAIIDTIASDLLVVMSDVKVVNSDLIVTNGIIDTITSDFISFKAEWDAFETIMSDFVVKYTSDNP